MPTVLDAFREVWLVGFRHSTPSGERPIPACLVALEHRSGEVLRLGLNDLIGRREPPFPTGPNSLYVAFEPSAALGCHLALGWPDPARIVDLSAEFRCRTAGLRATQSIGEDRTRLGLLNALVWFGLGCAGALEGRAVRELVRHGGPWSAEERDAVLDDCEAGVMAMGELLTAMSPGLDLPGALLRGRYAPAVAKMEWAGVPIDVTTLGRIRAGWDALEDRLVLDVDRRFGVFDGPTFRADRWAEWVERRRLSWPRLESGELAMDDESFREMALADADVALMRELRTSIFDLRLCELTVGSDGRNRTALNPFHTKTGRNQPSPSRSIFGPAKWIRGLIRPGPGRALAYLDWEQQEFGIAAALSGDPAMMDAYHTGDPYLAFALQSGRLPADASGEARETVRRLAKECVLGVSYGMGEATLARRIGRPVAEARTLLRLHREAYRRFWSWSEGAENHALLLGFLHTVFGWTVRVGAEANVRSLRNFACQGNGAEMLRLACCLATERGVTVCAPVHDALLVEGPADGICEVVERAGRAMAEASEAVLSGFRLRTAAKVARWPDRFMDGRGRGMWDRVLALFPEAGSVSGTICKPTHFKSNF